MRTFARGLLGFAVLLIGVPAMAEPQLYETGPTEDASFVRFVNATDNAIAIVSANGSAKVELSARDEGRVSHYFSVKAGAKLSATLQYGGRKDSVDVTGKPWEYITIAILPGSGGQVKTMPVRESPTDFNAMRSSLALFNLDAKCGGALMQAKSASVFDQVKPFTVQRRLVNPVKLSVTVGCGAPGTTVDMAQLQAGERYSVFLLASKNAQKAFFVRDAN